MKELLERIVKVLVDRPEAVEIREVAGSHLHVFELRVAKEDLGKVIGKGGANASAIRTSLRRAARRGSVTSWRSSKTDREHTVLARALAQTRV